MSTPSPTRTAPPPMPGPGRFIPPNELQALRRDPLAALVSIAARYGDAFRYPVGFWTIHVLNHPDLISKVLVEEQRNFTKDTFQYGLLSRVAGNGLLSSDGAFWLRQRRLAQPAFHHERLAALAGQMVAATDAMLERWEPLARQGSALDIESEMMRLALDILGRALFSQDLGGEATRLVRAVSVAMDHLAHRARNPFAPPTFIPTRHNRRYRAAVRTLDEAARALIEQRRQRPAEGDIVSLLLAARDPDTGEQMSDEQLRDEIVTLLIAGHETVASTLTWVWSLLGAHPQAERTLHAEIEQALGEQPLTLAALPSLPYARMVLDETLRLYPASWIITRRATQETTLGGYALPAGALVVLSPFLTQRHPAFWPEPDRFDPTRFAGGSPAAPRFAYFPFGGGPRLCIGRNFSLMEAHLVIVQVARRFRVVPLNPAGAEVEPLVTLRPKGGLWARLEPRRP